VWRSRRRSFQLTNAVTLVTFALACTSWKTQQVAPEQVLTQKRPDHVRVIQPGGVELELWAPRISSDSLVGRRVRKDSTSVAGIPLSDVTRLQVRELTTAGTLGVVVGTVGVSALLIAALVSYDNFRGWGD
jgi:hypothetical protein